jgi:hypothetical protein
VHVAGLTRIQTFQLLLDRILGESGDGALRRSVDIDVGQVPPGEVIGRCTANSRTLVKPPRFVPKHRQDARYNLAYVASQSVAGFGRIQMFQLGRIRILGKFGYGA